MKLKFKNQDFQTDAVNAVADLFTGQEKSSTTFSIIEEQQTNLFQDGIGNALVISKETLLENMHTVQRKNQLPKTNDSENCHFSIEMETGTGKTYVYTKTIFELNKRYGFTKFIIVVPSVAIREGVYKSLQITQEHFARDYDHVPHKYFIYNSQNLSVVRDFATSANIQIMIINIDAFKKAENIINKPQEKLNDETAMRYIQDTNPVVIIDEPQSVDNTDKAKEAIASLNPLCVLRYSATHREKVNLLYRLTPVDAYQMGLVKQICVSSNSIDNDFNKPYIALKSVSNAGGFSAKVEIDVEIKNRKGESTGVVERKTFTLKQGDDLFEKSGNRELYEGYSISGIDCTKGFECLEFANSEVVKLGEVIGSVDENILKRTQIYRTIEAHLEKEKRYHDKGIKVLSLFFIDRVEKYRAEDGSKGIYAEMFEECYAELIEQPRFAELKKRLNGDIEVAHNGYFSQDKKGKYKDTKGDTQADDDTYNTIMRDKEWLLSFECPLRFIFSHSALKEGWDNPNVFQVCTLIEQKSTFTARQKVGRGLRLCVNQDGERIEDKNINILHVMANESFAEFADKLQKEIEQETGVKFGVIDLKYIMEHYDYTEEVEVEREISENEAVDFVETLKEAGFIDKDGRVNSEIDIEEIALPEALRAEVVEIAQKEEPISAEKLAGITYKEVVVEDKKPTHDEAVEIFEELKKTKIIDKNGKLDGKRKEQLLSGEVKLSERYSDAKKRNALLEMLQKADNKLPIKNYSDRVVVKLKKEVVDFSPEFKELWEKIKQKTTYRIEIDSEKLTTNCVEDLKKMPALPKARIVTERADIDVKHSGVSYIESLQRTIDVQETYNVLPDILRLISTETQLKRSTVANIINKSGKGKDFLRNPQVFYEKALEVIRRNRHDLAIEGISYEKLAGEEYYVQEIFDREELDAYLERNAIPVKNSVYDHIVYDSGVESRFAQSLDKDDDVKMFFKIPENFKIQTPIGTYNPDWAVYLEKNGVSKLYLVLETKGTTSPHKITPDELKKIHCGTRHFDALDGVEFSQEPVKDWNEFKRNI